MSILPKERRFRLSTLSEYIDDTEAFINIVQDKHRNQLLQVKNRLKHKVLIVLNSWNCSLEQGRLP